MRIEKKTWPECFQDVIDGTKKYELRLNDFECNPGDILVLREWDPGKKEYTGRVVEKRVTLIKKFKVDEMAWPKEEVEKFGLQIMSID